ncbi:hypothetical protein [Faecalimonas sp.]
MARVTRITKEQKIIFANVFYLSQDGYKALEAAKIPKSLDNLQKLLSDKSLSKYIDKYSEVMEIMEGRTKEAHIAKLEELFDKAAGKKPLNDWDSKKDQVKKIDFKAAVSLSERIESIKDWGRTGNDIEIELELGSNMNDAITETEEKRDSKVEAHLRKEGVM